MARLRHPNVVQIYDVGQAEGLPFVALELLEGGSLEARVAGTPQPERASAELLVTLAGAIAAAHRAGVVHRDLKSANVLFATDGTPKIADFGLAKRLDEDDGQTRSGQVMGSPSFMAPEQARGPGPRGRPGGRPLLARRDPLRDAHRPAPVQGAVGDGDAVPGRPRRARARPPGSAPASRATWRRSA